MDDAPALFCIELRTRQWAALVAWYRDVLGLRVLLRVETDGYALLAAGGTRLAIVGRPDANLPTNETRLVFEVAELATSIARWQAAGHASPTVRADPEGYDELRLDDPDGRPVRVIAWRECA